MSVLKISMTRAVLRLLCPLCIVALSAGCQKAATPPKPADAAAGATPPGQAAAAQPGAPATALPGAPGPGPAIAPGAPGSQAPGGQPAEAPVKPVPAVLPTVVAKVNGEAVQKWEIETALKQAEATAGGPVPKHQSREGQHQTKEEERENPVSPVKRRQGSGGRQQRSVTERKPEAEQAGAEVGDLGSEENNDEPETSGDPCELLESTAIRPTGQTIRLSSPKCRHDEHGQEGLGIGQMGDHHPGRERQLDRYCTQQDLHHQENRCQCRRCP